MAGFVLISAFGGVNSPVDAFSFPDRVSLCVTDDGSGGGTTINLNGLGVNNPTVSGAVDLRTFFGAALFKSIPLLLGFRAVAAASGNNAEVQFVQNLEVTFTALTGATTKLPAVGYLVVATGGQNVPFLQLVGPGVAGTWRVDIRLRHSLTG